MSDRRLRQAERDTSPAGRARLLRERLRAGWECSHCWLDESRLVTPRKGQGTLGPGGKIMDHCTHCAGLSYRERLELAAYCGDEAAWSVLGWRGWWADAGKEEKPPSHGYPLILPSGTPGGWTTSLDAWTRGLSRWGRAVCVRAACAAARVALPAWFSRHAAESHDVGMHLRQISGPPWACCDAPLHAIEAAEAWLACPCEEHEQDMTTACELRGTDTGDMRWIPCSCLLADHRACDKLPVFAASAADLTSEAAVREAMQRALVTWALG